MWMLGITGFHRPVVRFFAQDPSARPHRLHDVPNSGLEIVNVRQHGAAVSEVEAARVNRPIHYVVRSDLSARTWKIIKKSWISVRCKNEALWATAFRELSCNGASTGSDLHATPSARRQRGSSWREPAPC